MSSEVSTVTRSPGRKRLSARKLAPSPSECAFNSPVCGPVRDPVTVIFPNSSAGAPRKLIWVRGAALVTPGAG